jgi:sulfatase modifying factor 1
MAGCAEMSGGVTHQLLRIPAGNFWMGDDAGRADERPRHEVHLAGFAAARTPVTNGEYACFLDATGHEPPRFWRQAPFDGERQPVVGVNWQDAIDYCAWLSEQLGRLCRLPTEAEWEYAARGGAERLAYAWGEEPPLIGGVSLAHAPQDGPSPAGTTPANGFGLVDAGFNVHEWCLDWYEAGYYARSPRSDPRGPEQGERRVSRGGAWRHQIKVSRCAARSSLRPDSRYNDYGFRVFAEA